ncbi:MAG: D-alanyl-D-alanine carboxypeptidase, partial [Clostridia bacterium]|nr:D-alanyl-D-alanine carboxypeptidase [Clostridia bacterium]
MIKRIIICLAALLLSAIFAVPNRVPVQADGGDSEAVVDIDSGRFLYEKNAYEKRHIASLTKIMTAIVVIENSDTEKVITVPEKCCGIEGSSIYLRAGE